MPSPPPDRSTRASGRLVGVGVGPGDPELLTRQAVRTLEAADRVAAPTVGADIAGRAETVVLAALPDLRIDRLPFVMATDATPEGAAARAESHLAAADALIGWLDDGETVAFVTLGDPNVYSTFPTVAAAVRNRRPDVMVETVAGICAFQALAARSGTVLLDGVETLALVTALDGVDHVRDAVDDPARAVVVYKGGARLPDIAGLLAERGRLDGAVMGELLGLADERVAAVADVADQEASYLATVIVPPSPRAWA